MSHELSKTAYAYLHVNGCGKPMFYLKEKPMPGQFIGVNDVVPIKGISAPVAGEVIKCGSCGGLIKEHFPNPNSVSQIARDDAEWP